MRSYGAARQLANARRAFGFESEERAAGMVRMPVREQHTVELKAASSHQVDNPLHVPCRIHEPCALRALVADHVSEVDHLAREVIALGEVAAREPLLDHGHFSRPWGGRRAGRRSRWATRA